MPGRVVPGRGMRGAARFLLVCLALALAAGCATRPPQAPLPASNAGLQDFSLEGRVAVKVAQKGYSTNLRWRHSQAADALRLLSPVGTTIATLDATPEGVTLVDADRQVHRSRDIEALTREVLGWDLPLDGLKHWVLGRADPGAPVDEQARDDRNRLTRLRQSGWQIAYPAYAEDGALPARLTLTREGLHLKLVIDRWEFPG
ncbi:MAG TPA: lipoprotein insertase outer membrane protein LolB [Burkholderiales bacterium]|nr:lipoprotein insertase outer membrane protein LolB [Burkholderiales bacterium]